MAIDMSTENSSLLLVSPRISFSHDFCHTGGSGGDEIVTPPATTATEDRRCRRDSSLLDLGKELSEEFDFCISTENIEDVQTCTAEELFSNGLIRTVHLQEKKLVTSSSTKSNVNNSNIDSSAVVVNGGCTSKAGQIQFQAKAKVKFKAASLPPLPTNTNGILISKQEISNSNSNSNPDHNQEKNQSKSFWKIKRSSSLHCDNKKSSFWSLPLLSRSNSTGSVPNNNNNSKQQQQQQTNVKENNQNRQNGNNSRQQIKNISRVSSSSSAFYVYPLSQKPPLMRRNNNGVRINPVLNVPSPHISKGTANLLGLGSFFRSNGKDKKIKK